MRDPRITAGRRWEEPNGIAPSLLEASRAQGLALAGDSPDPKGLRAAADALSGPHGLWQAFHDAFVDAVRGSNDARTRWTDAIEKELGSSGTAIEAAAMLPRDKDQLRGVIDEWKKERNPYVVWGHLPQVHLFQDGDLFYWLPLLARINPARGLVALDRLPYPSLMSDILSLYLSDDRDLIREFVELSPPVFDAAGAWRCERSVAALFATDLIVRHARVLLDALAYAERTDERAGAAHVRDTVTRNELPQWMADTFGALVRRSDGHQIACAYLARLARGVLLGEGVPRQAAVPAGPERPWTPHSLAARALTEVLRAERVTIAAVRRSWLEAEGHAQALSAERTARRAVARRPTDNRRTDREGEGARTLYGEGLPFLFGGALLLGEKPESRDEILELWTWFEELLVHRDPGLSLLRHGTALGDVPQRMGFLIAHLESPEQLLRTAYRSLKPQRRRALYAHRYDELYPDSESVLLLRVAMNAAANSFDRHRFEATLVEMARSNFFWAFDAARTLWLTAVLDTEATKEHLVIACFAFMPFLFGDQLEAALKRTIPCLGKDPRLVASAAASLRANGVLHDRLARAMANAGESLEEAIRDAHAWSSLTGLDRDFPEQLRTLATELGINTGDVFAKAPAYQRPGERAEFSAMVPWGTSLLRRLEADGCAHTRTMPLDPSGSAWVVQTTLPPGTRDSYGLAPEVRILATRVRVRSQDLRRASEYLEGASEVDPDLLLVARDGPAVSEELRGLAGPWGQRVPWAMVGGDFAPMNDALGRSLPSFDVFSYRDPVRGRAFLGRTAEVERLNERIARGQATGVFGLRKVGKSSLVEAVIRAMDPVATDADGSSQKIGATPGTDMVAMWIDVQGIMVRTREALAERLAATLAQRLRELPPGTSVLEPQSPTPSNARHDTGTRANRSPRHLSQSTRGARAAPIALALHRVRRV